MINKNKYQNYKEITMEIFLKANFKTLTLQDCQIMKEWQLNHVVILENNYSIEIIENFVQQKRLLNNRIANI